MNRSILARFVCALTLLSGVALLASCNTVEGAGKDVQAVGEATSDAAKSTKEAITK